MRGGRGNGDGLSATPAPMPAPKSEQTRMVWTEPSLQTPTPSPAPMPAPTRTAVRLGPNFISSVKTAAMLRMGKTRRRRGEEGVAWGQVRGGAFAEAIAQDGGYAR